MLGWIQGILGDIVAIIKCNKAHLGVFINCFDISWSMRVDVQIEFYIQILGVL